MKKVFLIAIVLVATIGGHAQNWQTDFATAKQLAAKEGKPIILVFQGSDWCVPCIKLDREVWSTEAFKKYSAKNYVMLLADFPRKSKNALPETQIKANAQLAEKYNKNGIFPFVVVLDLHGKVLGETSYKKATPENYIKELNSFMK
jgi:thioredoxin-related protein